MTPSMQPPRRGRIFRALLRLLPSEFRGDFGAEMSQTFEDEHRDAATGGRLRVAGLWARTVGGIFRIAPREHAEVIVRDTRYALRVLRKHPLTTGAAVLTMALGIGLNTAMFSVVHAVLYGLPFANPDRIARITIETRPGRQPPAVTLAMFDAWQHSAGFEALAAVVGDPRIFRGDDVERVAVECASPSIFKVLGASPEFGRVFTDDDDRPDRPPVVVISHAFWTTRLNADPAVIGRTIPLGDSGATVIGIMPSRFAGPYDRIRTVAWAPLRPMVARLRASNPAREPTVNVFARLASGGRADVALAPLASTIAAAGVSDHDAKLVAIPMIEQLRGDVQPLLLALWAATALVLLIACANVAGVILGRVEERRQEVRVRFALGSTRGRVMRQLVTESAVLSMFGGAAGVLLAMWSIATLTSMAPPGLFGASQLTLDRSVLLFAIVVSMATGLIFGIPPALQATRRGLTGSGRTVAGGPRRRIWQQAVVAGEIGLSLAVVIGAGLLVKTFLHLRPDAPGFEFANRIVVNAPLLPARYKTDAMAAGFYDELTRRLLQLPGVESVAASSALPLSGTADLATFRRETTTTGPGARAFSSSVSANFFEQMGVSIVEGRSFTSADTRVSTPVVIVSQGLAGAIGRAGTVGTRLIVKADGVTEGVREIVGVAGDTRLFGNSIAKRPQVYLPLAQTSGLTPQLVVRTAASPVELTTPIRKMIRGIDSALPRASITAMSDDVQAQVSTWRFAAWVMSGFAILAIALAGIGLFAIVGWSVTERTREIGIRMALGAGAADVVRAVLARAGLMTLSGLVAGFGLALFGTKMLSEWLVDVSPLDVGTFVLAGSMVALVAVAASVLPARRALAVDPVRALRTD